MKKGRTVDKWFAGTQLVIAALGTITLAVQIGAGVIGEVAAGVAAIAGTLGMGSLFISDYISLFTDTVV